MTGSVGLGAFGGDEDDEEEQDNHGVDHAAEDTGFVRPGVN
jgi:hypothetical protein